MNKIRLISGITFIVYGLLNLISLLGLVDFEADKILGVVLITTSLPIVYLSFNNSRREFLIAFTILFMIGIIFLVKSNFEIFQTRGLIFSSILLIGGALFIILYVENQNVKNFLPIGFFLLISGYLSVNLLRDWGVINFADTLADKLEDVWPVILILSGLIVFLNRKK